MLFVVFSLVVFNILSLSLTFASLITMCLSVFLLGFILPGTLCFPYLSDYFLSHVKEVFSNYPFKYFLRFFLSLFSLWDPYIVSVVLLNVVTKLFRVSSFFSFFFFYILFCSIDFYHSILQLTYRYFCLSYSVINSFECLNRLCPLVHLGL